jgi:hypothetical protein
MHFFLYEIVARIVGIYICVDCGRTVWRGLGERKIRLYHSSDFLDLVFDWSNYVAHRDAAPVRYWMTVTLHGFASVSGFIVAIFGWWDPKA